MSGKTPPGLTKYIKIVITAIRQSSTHRDLAKRAETLYGAVSALEKKVTESTRRLDQLLADAHGWTTLPRSRWLEWTNNWKHQSGNVVRDAEFYLASYPEIEWEFLRRARELSIEYNRLLQVRRKSPWQRGLETIMRSGLEFLEYPDLLMGDVRVQNRKLRTAVAQLKPGL